MPLICALPFKGSIQGLLLTSPGAYTKNPVVVQVISFMARGKQIEVPLFLILCEDYDLGFVGSRSGWRDKPLLNLNYSIVFFGMQILIIYIIII